ncbi:hypothetical protein, partial [Lentilactobacillus hilgardii]|uniref:hypothetical protein n=1 Tax=Lentilactobacillus hilgardii TaxID=1588 RepID=UPI001CC1F323
FGEDFRVTNEQWSLLMYNLDYRVVPTCLVGGRKGDSTFNRTGIPGIDTMKKELKKALNE